jgi:hypothetical protein
MYFLDIYKFFVCDVLDRHGTISTHRALGQTCPSFYYLGMTLPSSKLLCRVGSKKVSPKHDGPVSRCPTCLACCPATTLVVGRSATVHRLNGRNSSVTRRCIASVVVALFS